VGLNILLLDEASDIDL
jgi:hypothetical protein